MGRHWRLPKKDGSQRCLPWRVMGTVMGAIGPLVTKASAAAPANDSIPKG
jgi:hypothetical protein